MQLANVAGNLNQVPALILDPTTPQADVNRLMALYIHVQQHQRQDDIAVFQAAENRLRRENEELVVNVRDLTRQVQEGAQNNGELERRIAALNAQIQNKNTELDRERQAFERRMKLAADAQAHLQTEIDKINEAAQAAKAKKDREERAKEIQKVKNALTERADHLSSRQTALGWAAFAVFWTVLGPLPFLDKKWEFEKQEKIDRKTLEFLDDYVKDSKLTVAAALKKAKEVATEAVEREDREKFEEIRRNCRPSIDDSDYYPMQEHEFAFRDGDS